MTTPGIIKANPELPEAKAEVVQQNIDKELTTVPTWHRPDFNTEVLKPLQDAQAAEAARIEAERIAAEEAARLAAEEAERQRIAAEVAQQQAAAYAAQQAQARRYRTVPVRVASPVYGGLTGSYGFASPYGNCVNEPGINNPGWGNPIDWPVTSYSPWIGATALFTYNHVAYITGLWSNGDIEVRHQNFQGGQTRFSRSSFRGFR